MKVRTHLVIQQPAAIRNALVPVSSTFTTHLQPVLGPCNRAGEVGDRSQSTQGSGSGSLVINQKPRDVHQFPRRRATVSCAQVLTISRLEVRYLA